MKHWWSLQVFFLEKSLFTSKDEIWDSKFYEKTTRIFPITLWSLSSSPSNLICVTTFGSLIWKFFDNLVSFIFNVSNSYLKSISCILFHSFTRSVNNKPFSSLINDVSCLHYKYSIFWTWSRLIWVFVSLICFSLFVVLFCVVWLNLIFSISIFVFLVKFMSICIYSSWIMMVFSLEKGI